MPEVKRAMLAGFARRLDIEPEQGDISAIEEALARQAFSDEIGRDEFVEEIDDPRLKPGVLSASVSGRGGTISAHVRLEGNRLREVLITGDFFVTPPRVILDLEASLRGVEVERVGVHVESFFANAEIGMLSATPGDFSQAICSAIASSADRPPR